MRSGIIAETLTRFFTETAPLSRGESLVVAFSGGPDSTALLWGLTALRDERGIELLAAHLDHGLDARSHGRAAAAARLAGELSVPFVCERATEPTGLEDRRGLEDWARRTRYAYLDRQRERLGARFVTTAHHRDDQIETVLLRLLLGSGLEGLGGMSPIRGSLARPLLSLSRRDLESAVRQGGLRPVEDATNAEVGRPRNLIRLHLLPYLEADAPEIAGQIHRLGVAGQTAAEGVSARLLELLAPAQDEAGASIDLEAFRSLPPELDSFALSLLHRRAGLSYPAPGAAQRELRQQLDRGGRIGCDCGESWYWRDVGDRLSLRRRRTPPGRFTYTLQVPGELEIPELGVRVSVRREVMAPWMLEGRPTRAALDLPLASGDDVVLRNRWPGDRIRPLGCRYSRRLKEVLIDRRVPREERDRLPLLCIGDRIAWVPGVTVDDSYRLSPTSYPWVASIEPTRGASGIRHRPLPVDSIDD